MTTPHHKPYSHQTSCWPEPREPRPKQTRLRFSSWYLVLVVLPLFSLSCKTFDPPLRDVAELRIPEAYTLYEETAPGPDRWWEGFQAPELDSLIESTLRDNLSLQQVYARMEQAAALARQANAAKYPSLSYSGDASISQTRVDTGGSAGGVEESTQQLEALNGVLGAASGLSSATSLLGASQDAQSGLQALETLLGDVSDGPSTDNVESYSLGLVSQYEVDLWGKVRADVKSAEYDYGASLDDAHTAMQSLASQVALAWFDLLQYRQTLSLVQEQLATNEQVLELIELRSLKGISSSLDVLQQRQAVEEARAAVPPLESSIQSLHHEIALLTGQPPRSELALTQSDYPERPRLPDPGLPADLLARRPDVRAAGLLLQAADWQVSAARAARLPSLELAASASASAGNLDLIFGNWIATLAASVTGPIFDGGQRAAEVTRTRAVVKERLAAYRESVYTAVKEVEDALLQESKQAEYLTALRAREDVAQAYYDEAVSRYLKGLNDYLPVLTALTSLQSIQRSVIGAEHDLFVYRVALYRALGGSWTQDFLPEMEERHEV